jgi:dienelactone hydrolase
MLELAEATAREIPAILGGIAARGLGDCGRAGLAGVSMGAFVVYRALQTVPVRAAVAALGSPEWPGAGSPHRAPRSTFRDVALLSITAERDESVPPHAARDLHRRLAADGAAATRQGYLELPGASHLVDARGWETIISAAVAWLASALA